MPIDRIKPRPLVGSHPGSPTSGGIREAEARARVTAMFRQVEALKNAAQVDSAALAAIVAQAQATLVQIQQIELEFDASVADLQQEIATLQAQLAALGATPASPTLSVVGPPVAHVAIVRITRANAAAHSFVAEFKADASDLDCPWVPVTTVRAAQFASNYTDVTVLTDRKTVGTFRAYALSYGVPSVSAETALDFTGPLLAPDTVLVEADNSHLFTSWDASSDPRVFDYELRFHAATNNASLSVASSVVVYTGRALSFVLAIPFEDRDKSFGFWVTTRARP